MALWTPAFRGNELRVWLRGDFISGVTDGGAVASWPDGSVYGKNAVQATSENQPSYKASAINSLPAVEFSAADQYLQITSMGWSKPITIMAVVQATGGSPSANATILSAGTGIIMRVIDGTGSGVNDWVIVGNATLEYGTDAYDTNPHLHVGIWDGSSSLGAFNGTSVTGDSGSTGPNATLTIGNASNAVSMYLAELVIFFSHVSTTIQQQWEGYAAHRYGLTANLPGDHPYKSAAPVVTGSSGSGVV
jgi:hypothetical protein